MNTRAVAARILVPVLQQKASLDASIEHANIDDTHRPWIKECSFGVCRYYFSLNAIAEKLLAKPLKPKDADLHALLLIGLYQLWRMRVPDHAAINETVSATKSLKKHWAKNLINGVLRNFLREKDALITKLGNTDYNHPPWLLQAVKSAWPESWKTVLEQNNQQAPFTLRTNQRNTSRDNYSSLLEKTDIAHHACEYSREGITLHAPVDVTQLPGFSEGSCSVQDEAAQLSASLLDLKPGQRVLDACCAPGGKTCHIAESEPDLKHILALDIDAGRLEKVTENLTRLKLQTTTQVGDSAELTWWDNTKFDRILLDAPCSATGVIRRHPDIKLLRRESDIDELSALQLKILQNLWQTLNDGGLLLYATCSILPQENENLIKTFVEQQHDAIHLPIEASWGEKRAYGRQLFPQPNGHDGFYYSRIKKGSF